MTRTGKDQHPDRNGHTAEQRSTKEEWSETIRQDGRAIVSGERRFIVRLGLGPVGLTDIDVDLFP